MSALLPAALVAGCDDFLADPQAINNPNFPTNASINQLFVGVEVGQTTTQAGDLARTITTFMQQFSGTDRQYFQLSNYQYGEDTFDDAWNQIYQGGGLLDIRRVEALADTAQDATYGGIARVWEALTIGTAADLWGDIPLTSALQVDSAPKLTEQAEVYTTVQAKLDTALTLLGQNRGAGPGAADLFYGGDRQKYIRLARTLKARYYLHTAERPGNAADGGPAFDAATYQRALAEAQQGLRSGDDFRTFQSSNPNESNLWYQFTVVDRAGYISPSAFFVNLLTSRNDPRLRRYFAPPTGSTTIAGAVPVNGGPPGGTAVLNPEGGAPGNPAYQAPVVTFAENQHIIAEAAFRLGQPGVALAAINAYEATVPGLQPTTAATLSLQEIMTRKYIALFQQIEVWNDYKRTCVPRLTPVAGTIPARLIYPQVERIANPNIADPTDQPARNDNDPNPCPGSD